jgi:uncharacterized damage-inducible protein DinB
MKKLFTLCALALPAFSQTSVKDAMIKHWKATGQLTIAVAKAMPNDDYTFRPNPEEMSFGQLMAHIGLADAGACAVASGLDRIPVPEKVTAWVKDQKNVEIDKETAVQYLTDTFAFCDKAVAAMTPERLDKVQGPAQRNLTGFEWLWSYFTHTAHHRGQAEVYLRVKGLTPPTYTF